MYEPDTLQIEKRKPETKEQKEKRLRDRELNDLRIVLSNPEGRRFMWRLMEKCKFFVDGYIHGDAGYGTTYNAGRKNIGLWTLEEITAAKQDAFTQIQREHLSEAKREEMEEKDKVGEKDILKINS
jgi:hypothetical protein